MPLTTTNRLGKFRRKTTRKRTSVITKAKYKPRTAKANRSLIKQNAYAIRAVKRLMPPRVWHDYQLSGTLFADTIDGPDFTTSYRSVALMDPVNWRRCLRQDDNAYDAACTRVLRMSMNLRYTLYQSNWAQITMFIVTIRKDISDFDIGTLQIGQDYINSFGQDMNVRLNSAIFKVHATRNVTLTKNNFLGNAFINPDTGTSAAFNPALTFSKGQVNVKINMRIRNPIRANPWKEMEIDQFSPNQRYYLLCFFTQQCDAVGVGIGARVDYDMLATCLQSA